MRRPAIALFAFVIALSVVHAIVGFWTPVMGDDWNHWIWAGRHRNDATGEWLVAFLKAHLTFSEAAGYLLARCRIVHVLVTPAVVVALIVGLFTVAMRRVPRATWDDVISIGLISALIWTGQPHAAATLFHAPSVALFVYGSTLAVWFIAPLRCDWRMPRALWPLMALAGYCVGTSTRAIGTAVLVYFILVLRKRRTPWLWIAFAGLLIGVIVGYVVPPWFELGRIFRRGFEANLVGQGLVKYMVEECGEVISFVLALVLADVALGLLGRSRAPVDARPDPTHPLHWLIAWFLTSVWCLFGPDYDQFLLLPATCMLIIAAVPTLAWLAQSHILRYVLIATAVAVHIIAWSIVLVHSHDIGEQGAARMRILQSTPPGQIAVIPTYNPVPPSSWFHGEDFDLNRVRQLVAIEAFGLRDIVVQPPFRRLDPNPHIEIALESDGPTDGAPTMWVEDVLGARKQFEFFVKRAADDDRAVSARLVVKNIELAERGTRPMLAGWADSQGTMIPRVVRSSIDSMGEVTVKMYRPWALQFDEAYIIEDGKARKIPYRAGALRLHPTTAVLNVAVACNKSRCLVLDAFIPHF